MEKFIDLHTHTTASDGSLSPRELVRQAKEAGLHAVAITDHDTVAGVEEALETGREVGLEVVPGVEIGVEYKPEMHMLGYFFHDTYQNIRRILITLKENREERNPKIIKRLNELGFDITMEEVVREAAGGIVGRPHIAKVLVSRGYFKSMAEVFDRYLASGRPAYFKKDKLTPEEGIREIIEAGGIPVLAHPILLGMGWSTLDKVFGELKASGLKGIEAYYVDNAGTDTGNLLRLAKKHGMLATGGSDFHGTFKSGISIGIGRGNLKVPFEALEEMKNTARHGQKHMNRNGDNI